MDYKEILVQIRQIVRSVNLESKRIEKENGLSIPQLLCLNFLSEKTSFEASHKEIKDFLKLNASTVTGIISRLEKKGFVARLPKKQDKRIGLVALTAKGIKLLEKTPEPLHEQLSHKLKQLAPGEIDQLQKSFEVIIDLLNIEDVDAAPILTGETEIRKEED